MAHDEARLGSTQSASQSLRTFQPIAAPSQRFTPASERMSAGRGVRPRVYINGRFLAQRVTGIQRYSRETLLAMDERLQREADVAEHWTLLVPPGTEQPPLRFIKVQEVGRLRGHLWEQLSLPWHSRTGLLIGFGLTGPLLKRRQIITLHDASVVRMPQTYGWRFRTWYRAVVALIGARAPMIMAVSQFSAAEAVDAFGVSRGKLRLATEGWQHLDRIQADDSVLDRHGLRGKAFALAVSSPAANKNFAVIAKALKSLGPAAPLCAAVGAVDTAVFAGDTVPEGLLRLGYVTDGELKSLYQHASCFVFPSLYEGFGIPVIEAMSCGCPVLASTAPALREVCGDAALLFDPNDAAALASLLKRVLSDAPLREQLRAKGRARSEDFSWSKSGALNVAAVREAVWL